MRKLFLKKQVAKLLLISSSLLIASSVLSAQQSNLDLEVKITAKSQASDLKTKILSYIEDVRITQGTVIITAELAKVHKQKDTEDNLYILQGKPAIFEQTLDDGSKVRLEADEIKFEPATHMVTVTKNAHFISAVSDVRASKITYNTQTKTQQAESDADEIVTTILKPALLKAKIELSKAEKEKAEKLKKKLEESNKADK